MARLVGQPLAGPAFTSNYDEPTPGCTRNHELRSGRILGRWDSCGWTTQI